MVKRYLTPIEVAEELSVSTSTVLRLVHEGRLPAVRVSERIYRIPIPAFERFKSGAKPPEVHVVMRSGALSSIGADEPLPRPERLAATRR